MTEDPFVVLESESPSKNPLSGLFTDPLEHISQPVNFEGTKVYDSINGGLPGDSNVFNEGLKSEPFFTTETNEGRRDKSPVKNVQNISAGHGQQPPSQSPVDSFENIMPKMQTSKPSDSQKSGEKAQF